MPEPDQSEPDQSEPNQSGAIPVSVATIPPAEPATTTEEKSSFKRCVEATSFVAVWMAIGFGVRSSGLDRAVATNAYLLVGVPLMALFQRYVRRERLVTLWARNAQRFNPGVIGLTAAACFAAAPAYELAQFDTQQPLPQVVVLALWLVASLVGALGAGFCLRHLRLHQLRQGLPGFIAAVVLGVGVMALAAIAAGKPLLPIAKTALFAKQLLLYFSVCFVLEEVVFRGMLDPHLRPQPAPGWWAWLSAFTVSILWGLWHLPVVPIPDVLATIVIVPALCLVHVSVGLPLSFCSRSSGSLLLPSLAHALIDAYRNAALM